MPIRIVFLIDNLDRGGKERRMLELIKGLTGDPGYKVELVIFRDLIEYPEVRDFEIPLHIIVRKPKYNPLTFWRLYKICSSFQPDIIHAWSGITAIYAFPYLIINRCKMVNSSIAKSPAKQSIWGKDFLRTKLSFLYSDKIMSNSRAGLLAYGAPPSKSVCIPNGFDFNRLKKLESERVIRARYGLKMSKVIGMVAAFAPRKDYETFLKAAQMILEQRDDVKFMAVGDGATLGPLRKKFSSQLENKMIFTGTLSDVESVVNVFTVGVLLTNTEVHQEGISNSIMEFMALGKPVIATQGGGTDEIVLNGVTGFLVSPRDPERVATCVIDLLMNPHLADEMGNAGRSRIEDNFSLNKMNSAFKKVYIEMMDDLSEL